MLSREEKEAIEFAHSEISASVEILKKNGDKEKANFNEGVEFALEYFFEFDEQGKCLGLEKTTIYEYLGKKYSSSKKLK